MEKINETKDCIAHWITKVHLKLKNSMSQKVKQFNLTVEQRTILLLLFENDPMTQSEICKETSSEASNITMTLKRMKENGYIEKSKHPTDKRTTLISPTKKAYEIEDELTQIGEDGLNYLLNDISEEEHEIALKVMKEIYKKVLKEEFDNLL